MKGRPKKTALAPFFDSKKQRWTIDIPASATGKRKRRFFKTQHEALTECANLSLQSSKGQEMVCTEQKRTASISSLVDAYLAEREKETGAANITTLTCYLANLSKQFGTLEPHQITSSDIDAWIKGLKKPNKNEPYSTRSKFNCFAACRTFYNWRVVKDLVKDNPFSNPPPKKERGKRLPILTPDQMKTLLALDLAPYFKAWIVAGAFSGIRSCEFKRISYESIDYTHKEIVIREEESKQGKAARPRDIPIYPAFERHMPRGTGKLSGGASWKKVANEMAKAVKALGWQEWEKNSLRHSFASYALAQSHDPSKTAYELGHESPKLLFSTYGNKVTRPDAAAWWSL